MEGQFGWGREEGGWRKGPWTAQEDKLLVEYVRQHGEGRWNSVAKLTGTDQTLVADPLSFGLSLASFVFSPLIFVREILNQPEAATCIRLIGKLIQ
jgi:hypothetical protein